MWSLAIAMVAWSFRLPAPPIALRDLQMDIPPIRVKIRGTPARALFLFLSSRFFR